MRDVVNLGTTVYLDIFSIKSETVKSKTDPFVTGTDFLEMFTNFSFPYKE